MLKIIGAPNYIAVGENWRPLNPAGRNYLKADERAFKLRRASKFRPGDVFLQVGESSGLEAAIDFGECAEVTWAAAPVFDADLAYRPVRWK